jgi:metal-dependent amidase/aminoacylase/carboxypeptidase family protein
MNPVIPEHPGRGSSDFGNFSHVRPGVHTYFGIAEKEIAGHSPEFAAAAISDYGMKQMLNAAAAMAFAGYKFFEDEEFREQVLSK